MCDGLRFSQLGSPSSGRFNRKIYIFELRDSKYILINTEKLYIRCFLSLDPLKILRWA